MSFARIQGPLILVGSSVGSITLEAQATGADVQYLLPNTLPASGKFLSITSVSADGRIATLDWVDDTDSAASTPGGSVNQLQYNNAGAFGGAPNSFISGTGAVVVGNVNDPSPVSTTAFTVSASGGIAIHAQDWFSSNEGFVVASMQTSGLLNVQGINVQSSISIGASPAMVIHGSTINQDIAQFFTSGSASPASTKTVFIDFNGILHTIQQRLASDVQTVNNNAAPIYYSNIAGTQFITMTPNGFFGPQIQFSGQTGSFTNNARLTEIGAQGLYLIDSGIAISGNLGTNGQVLTSLGVDTDGGPKGLAWATPTSATPGGSSGDIQYNNAGAFAGSAATISGAGSLVIPSGQNITVQDLVNQGGHQMSISITDASNFAINAAGGSQFLIDSAGSITLTPASGHAATFNGVNTINAFAGSGLDISAAGTDLIQINGNSVGIINVHQAGVEINNNTTSASITVPTTGGVQIHSAAADTVRITTSTGVFEFFGTGNGMSLATQNAAIAIDGNGKITLGGASGQGIEATSFVVFDHNIDFSANNGHIAPNADMAGVANITTGTSVTVNFASAYTTPIVVVTPTTDPTAAGSYWVTQNGTSFTVNITNAVVISFNYHVMGN